MRFTVSKDLYDLMVQKKKTNIVVDVAESNASDIEVAEIFYRLCDDKHAEYLVHKKDFIEKPLFLDSGEGAHAIHKENHPLKAKILLKKYRFEMDDNVHFYRKKVLFMHTIAADGIVL